MNNHPEARPPRSYFDDRRIAERGGNRIDAFTSIAQNNAVVAAPLDKVMNRTAAFSSSAKVPGVESLRLARVSPQQRQDFEQRSAISREFAQRRAEGERTRQPGRNALNVKPLLSGAGQRPGERVAQRPNIPETGSREVVPRATEPKIGTPGEQRPGVVPGRVEPPRAGGQQVPPINREGTNPGRERSGHVAESWRSETIGVERRLPRAGRHRGQEPRPVGPRP